MVKVGNSGKTIDSTFVRNEVSDTTEIVPYYPDNNGAVRGTDELIYLREGELIDRYGKVTGNFFYLLELRLK